MCSGQIAGTWYGHETIMVHPLAYALAKDALANNGPGLLSRIDIDDVCGSYLAPGLGLRDLLLTENTLLYSMATLLLDSSKSTTEPPIKSESSFRFLARHRHQIWRLISNPGYARSN